MHQHFLPSTEEVFDWYQQFVAYRSDSERPKGELACHRHKNQKESLLTLILDPATRWLCSSKSKRSRSASHAFAPGKKIETLDEIVQLLTIQPHHPSQTIWHVLLLLSVATSNNFQSSRDCFSMRGRCAGTRSSCCDSLQDLPVPDCRVLQAWSCE